MISERRKGQVLLFVCCTFLLVLLFAIGLTPITANAATDGSYFDVVDVTGGVEIIGFSQNYNEYPESIIIPTRINNKVVKSIGNDAFKMNSTINTVQFESDSQVNRIGKNAFFLCDNLGIFYFPDSITTLDEYAFFGSGLNGNINFGSLDACTLAYIYPYAFANINIVVPSTLPKNLEILYDHAFYNTSFYSDYNFISSNITYIGESAFEGTNLQTINLTDQVGIIGANAFYGSSLTIYSEMTSAYSYWHNDWNSSNRPVIWNCTFDSTNTYVVTTNKTSTSIMNATSGMNYPRRSGYDFAGWYTTSDYSGTAYFNILEAPNGTLYAKWENKASCVAEGTMVTLANGSQVAVENLTGNEELLVWNMNTGNFDSAPILFVDSDGQADREIIHLYFNDGTELKIVDEHALWCFDLNEYVYLDSDAEDYIGKYFNKKTANGYTAVQLIEVEKYREIVRTYSPVTSEHLCYYVNGLLSIPGGISGMFNIFDVVATEMKYDQTAMQEDIATYGLFTYEEFCLDIAEISEETFNAFNGRYLKVSMGKGLINRDKILALIEEYQVFLI